MTKAIENKVIESNITAENIFEQGMLIHLSLGGYHGRVQLSEEQLKDLPKEIVRGVHDMFDIDFKSLLKDVFSQENEIRRWIKALSIPFPIDGVYFIPSKSIEFVIKNLEDMRIARKDLIQKTVDVYDASIKIFSEKYPDFYRHALNKYISKDQFADRFYFSYQFIKVQAPDKNSKFISPEMYKLEMQKFKESIEDMKKEVLSVIYTELIQLTKRLKTQCSDGKPNQRTFDSLNTFLSKIDNVYSDFIDRKDMKEVIEKIRKEVLGIDAVSLRDSENFKKKFGKEIASLAKEIKALPDIRLKRSIEF